MDSSKIKDIVYETLRKDILLFPDAMPEVDVTDSRQTGLRLRLWPDDEKSSHYHSIKAIINPPKEKNTTTSIEFLYREEPRAILIDNFQLNCNLRKKGLGRVLKDKMEEIAQNLGCEKRIFLNVVTNPSFWQYHKYTKFTEPLGYWYKQ